MGAGQHDDALAFGSQFLDAGADLRGTLIAQDVLRRTENQDVSVLESYG